MRNKRGFHLALGGICLAFTVVFLFAGSIVPGIELTLYGVSSLFIAVMMIEIGPKGGISLYVAAVLFGLILVPNKIGILPYVCLFGLYGIVKFYIEKLKHPVAQIILKLIFFSVVLAVWLLFFRTILLGNIRLPDYPIAILLLGGVIFLMIYDALYTFLINLYLRRIKKIHIPDIKVDQEKE